MTSAPPQPRHRWFAAVYDHLEKMDEKNSIPVRRFAAGGATGKVLEVGGGTGNNIPFYDWSKVESLEFTEPDPFMLQRAGSKAAALPDEIRGRISLRAAPAEELPFPATSFDTVVATLVYCTVSDPKAGLAEAFRVLKPGGTLRLAEHVAAEGFAGTVQHVIQPVYGWLAAGCQLSRDTEAAVRAAGFDLQVSRRWKPAPIVPHFEGVATKPAA